jgi:hypothetical protein
VHNAFAIDGRSDVPAVGLEASMRVRLTTAVAAIGSLVITVFPASAQTVDEIVSRHIEARGGYDRLKAIQSIKITRTVATPFNDIKVVVYKRRPQLFRADQGPAGSAMTARGINEQEAWDTVAGGKIVTRPPKEAAETRELDGDFDGLLVDWKQKGHTVSYEGKTALPGGGEAHKMKVVTKSGAERTIFLDAQTFLDRRHTGALNLPNNRRFDVTIDYSNWRDVNGVKFPFDINEERTGREPVQSFVTYTEKIEVNVPMDDALFATPAANSKQ